MVAKGDASCVVVVGSLSELLAQRHICHRWVGLHGKGRTVFDLTGHRVGQGDDVTIKGRAAVTQGM